MAEHELKVLPQFYGALEDGSKTFEVRKDDRGFQVGDTLRLREWSPERGFHNDIALDWALREVTYVLRGEEAERFGVQPGFCVLGISPAWELCLCETERVLLHADTAYIFRVCPDCKRCAEMDAEYKQAFARL